jgi:alkylated DNA repair dioxygenase AlkB
MSSPDLPGFAAHDLGERLWFLTGTLPAELVWDATRFDEVWALHPEGKHVIHMPGGPVETPRWQQAYGADYHYTGRTNTALPVPPVLEPLRAWALQAIDPRLNGVLLNWYEGPGHYIGPHHDSTREMRHGAPIVTISFGETRVFRLTRGRDEAREVRDFEAANGSVFVLPYDTNLAWKHAVPKSAKYRGRRISVTLRAFTSAGTEAAATA